MNELSCSMATSMFNQFKDIPPHGLIALISQNKVYLLYSVSLPSTFCTLLLKLYNNVHENEQLQAAYNAGTLEHIVIECYEHKPSNDELIRDYKKHLDDMLKGGFTDMREGLRMPKYRVKTYVLNDFRGGVSPLVYVVGKLKDKDVVMAVFESLPESEEWVTSKFGSQRVNVLPIYHDNELSLEYFKKFGKGLDGIRVYPRSRDN